MFVNGLYLKNVNPSRIFAGCIYAYENIWENSTKVIEVIEEEIKESENCFWQRATEINSSNNSQVTERRTNYEMSLNFLAENSDRAKDIYNAFYITLLNVSNSYAKKHNVYHLFHEGYNILKYSGGQEYKEHFDGTTDSGRSISAILYLNDDYEGGELEFPYFDLRFKPVGGSIYLFPSNFAYAHIAHPVTNGTKYAIVTWIHDSLNGTIPSI